MSFASTISIAKSRSSQIQQRMMMTTFRRSLLRSLPKRRRERLLKAVRKQEKRKAARKEKVKKRVRAKAKKTSRVMNSEAKIS